jgi:ubiquinone/menaquinone biosynthesis C-methylase UbiE
MNERVYDNGIERLRAPERIERLEVDKVVDLCLGDSKIDSVLDIGTGSGLFAEAFYVKGVKVAGIDLNPQMIETARNILPDCEFKISAAEELPYDDNSFDMNFIGVVFHEVDDYKKVLEETYRVAVKSVSILEWNYKTEEYGPPIEHKLSGEFINNIARESGFNNVKES